MRGTLCTRTADFVAGAALTEPRSADFVSCAALCALELQIAWQTQHLGGSQDLLKRALHISGSEDLCNSLCIFLDLQALHGAQKVYYSSKCCPQVAHKRSQDLRMKGPRPKDQATKGSDQDQTSRGEYVFDTNYVVDRNQQLFLLIGIMFFLFDRYRRKHLCIWLRLPVNKLSALNDSYTTCPLTLWTTAPTTNSSPCPSSCCPASQTSWSLLGAASECHHSA